jgi:hypothetical protein
MGKEQSGAEIDASHLLQDVLNNVFIVETVEQRLSLLRSDLSPKPITELYGYTYVEPDAGSNQPSLLGRYVFSLVLVTPQSNGEKPFIALKTEKFKKSFTEDLVRERLDATVSGSTVLREGILNIEEAEVNELEATGLVDGNKDAMSAILETHFDGYKVGLIPDR